MILKFENLPKQLKEDVFDFCVKEIMIKNNSILDSGYGYGFSFPFFGFSHFGTY